MQTHPAARSTSAHELKTCKRPHCSHPYTDCNCRLLSPTLGHRRVRRVLGRRRHPRRIAPGAPPPGSSPISPVTRFILQHRRSVYGWCGRVQSSWGSISRRGRWSFRKKLTVGIVVCPTRKSQNLHRVMNSGGFQVSLEKTECMRARDSMHPGRT